MALIKCPECGKEISDKAEICVNCGLKIAEIENLHEVSQKKEHEILQEQNNKTKSIIGVIIAIIVIIFFLVLFFIFLINIAVIVKVNIPKHIYIIFSPMVIIAK